MESPVTLIRKAIKSHQELSRLIMWIGVIFIILIFFVYPIFIKFLFAILEGKESGDFNRGTFGDMYGALNTFISSIAFVGATFAIIIQIDHFNREKKLEEQRQNERYYLKLKVFNNNLDNLKYKHLQPVLKRINIIKESGFKLSQAFIDSQITFHNDFYFRSLLNTPQNEIFNAIHSINRTQADEIIEFYFQLEMTQALHNNLNDLMYREKNELKVLQDKAFKLKLELQISQSSKNQFLDELKHRDIFDYTTLEYLEKFNRLEYPFIPKLDELITVLKNYHWTLDCWIEKIQEFKSVLDTLLSLVDRVKINLD